MGDHENQRATWPLVRLDNRTPEEWRCPRYPKTRRRHLGDLDRKDFPAWDDQVLARSRGGGEVLHAPQGAAPKDEVARRLPALALLDIEVLDRDHALIVVQRQRRIGHR